MSKQAIRYPRMHVVQAGGMAPMGIMDEVMAEEEARRAADTREARHEALVNAYLDATGDPQPRAYASVALEPAGRVDYYSRPAPITVTRVSWVARRFRYAHLKFEYRLS